MFIAKTDTKAETPILWPPYVKSWLIGKDSDAGRDWGQEEKGMVDGWMASPTQWTWVWVNSGSWCWTGRPGMLWFMGLQRVGHDWVTQLNWTELFLGSKVMTNLDTIFKSRDFTLPTKVHLVKAMVFPVVMYGCELDWEESWAPKNWCFWTMVLEKTLENPLDCKEIQSVHPKGV